jgi:hypothetical protein
MKPLFSRTPKDYDGSKLTSRQIKEILPHILGEIGKSYHERGDMVIAAWPEIIGPKFASSAKAVSFIDGQLTVVVKNSTLFSLLAMHEKHRLLKSLKDKLPSTTINNIFFRIG